jgi:hypothetical protein
LTRRSGGHSGSRRRHFCVSHRTWIPLPFCGAANMPINTDLPESARVSKSEIALRSGWQKSAGCWSAGRVMGWAFGAMHAFFAVHSRWWLGCWWRAQAGSGGVGGHGWRQGLGWHRRASVAHRRAGGGGDGVAQASHEPGWWRGCGLRVAEWPCRIDRWWQVDGQPDGMRMVVPPPGPRGTCLRVATIRLCAEQRIARRPAGIGASL